MYYCDTCCGWGDLWDWPNLIRTICPDCKGTGLQPPSEDATVEPPLPPTPMSEDTTPETPAETPETQPSEAHTSGDQPAEAPGQPETAPEAPAAQ